MHIEYVDGHDTSYSPEAEDANPKKDYTYSDADEAIGQPKLDPVVLFVSATTYDSCGASMGDPAGT